MYQNPEIEKLRVQQERGEKKLEQLRHREQQLENRIRYLEGAERRRRSHRLITRGAAVEHLWPEVKGLSEQDFYSLLSMEENIALARNYLMEQFVSRGMIVDYAVHAPDPRDGGIPNPHFHVLCSVRPLDEAGKWGAKQHRVYALDESGNRILDTAGAPVFNAVPTTDWGEKETLLHWCIQ